jgi:hypothetical protein
VCAAASSADVQAHASIAGETRPRHARAVRPAIVGRHHLDVLALPAAIRLPVLDADVGEMDLVIEVRQVVLVRPVANLIGSPIRVAVVVVVVPVARVEPALVLALELVVEDHALDVRAALQEPGLGLFAGAIELQVVLQFPLTSQARVKGLVVVVVAVSVASSRLRAALVRLTAWSRYAGTLVVSTPEIRRSSRNIRTFAH